MLYPYSESLILIENQGVWLFFHIKKYDQGLSETGFM